MPRMIYVVPAEGLSVRFPKTLAILPAAGMMVEETTFWLRRIADGSVREATPPAGIDEGTGGKPATNKRKEA